MRGSRGLIQGGTVYAAGLEKELRRLHEEVHELIESERMDLK